MKPNTKPPAPEVRCPFCGRRNTVRQMEDKLYFCSHCDQMFQL
jgi:ribosomal protein L37AE/L43A